MNWARTNVTRLCTVLGIGVFIIDLVAHHHIGAIIWVVMCYLFIDYLVIIDFTVLPNRKAPFCQTLTDDEFQYFRAYHVCLRYPHAADIYSAILNTLSMIGLVFAIMAFVDKGWLTGGLLIVYFLGANAYKMRIAPMEQTDKLAEKGDLIAKKRALTLRAIHEKLHTLV